MTRLTVGVIFGGVGEEHAVSVKSAIEVAQHLDPDAYEPVWIKVAIDGVWRLCSGPDRDTDEGPPVVLAPDRSIHGLLVLANGRYSSIHLDVVLPVLHGKLGEDGAIQGLLELAGLPYVGCDIASSAVCMDKALAYAVARSAGIATPDHWIVTGDDHDVDHELLTYPVFVKPARSGSSFGVSKVSEPAGLAEAVRSARRFDSKVLIERAVVGSEVGCAILGNGSDLLTGEVDRIALSHGFFRIHQEDQPELGSENSTFIVPADIPPDSYARVRETAMAIYRAMGCRGLTRVDLFLTEDRRIVLNEINTFPGLTSYSRYPRMMRAAGLSLADVLARAISLAMSKNVEES